MNGSSSTDVHKQTLVPVFGVLVHLAAYNELDVISRELLSGIATVGDSTPPAKLID